MYVHSCQCWKFHPLALSPQEIVLVAQLWTGTRQAPWGFPGKNIGMGCHFLLVKPFKKLRQLPGDRLKKGSKCLDWLESGEGKATERSAQGPWCETSWERHSFRLDF